MEEYKQHKKEDEALRDAELAEKARSRLERQRAKYLQKKRESAGLSKKQRQEATLAKLNMFKSGLHGPGAAKGAAASDAKAAPADETEGWMQHSLRFDRKSTMAESASHYDSFDPLKHGGDEGRALSKIKERERIMLSMKQGDAGHEDD